VATKVLKQIEREENELEEKKLDNLFDSLKKPSGKQFSLEENRLLLILIRENMKEKGWDKSKSIEYYSNQLSISTTTLFSLYNSFISSLIVPSPDTSKMGSGNSQHPLHLSSLTLDIECAIHRIIREYNKNKGFCSTPMIISSLFNELGVNIPIATMKRWLHDLNYEYGRSRTYGTMELAARKARTVNYIKQLSLAIKSEESGEFIICYMDESYVNLNHKIQYTWFNKNSEISNEVGGKPGKGERAIIIHSITKFGLLGGEIDDNNLGESFPSSQHIFIGGYIGEDYHKNMNSSLFLAWINNRFIPAFNHNFPGKKCILILDNAPYHHVKGVDYIYLFNDKKRIIEQLEKIGVTRISVMRNNKNTFIDKSRWKLKYSLVFPYSPSTLELRDHLEFEIKMREENQRDELEKIFNPLGWQLIFTPPYTPETQPIEKIWAFVKNYVAKNYNPNNNTDKLIKDIKRGFYGNPKKNHPGVTPNLCNKIITHCYNWCNDFIDKNMHSGRNLSTLVQHLSENNEEIIPNLDNSIVIEAEREEEERKSRDIFDFPSDDDENDI
jgi:hypothetical protein